MTLERDLAQVAVDELTSGVDPQLRFDVSRAQKRVDEITATIAQAELAGADVGTIGQFLAADPGEPIAAYDPIGLVADLTVLEITDDMNPEDLTELAEGMPLLIKRAALPGNVYSGTIAQLASTLRIVDRRARSRGF